MTNSAGTLGLLNTFVHIADGGSLSAAARTLNTSQASVSRQLSALERQMNTSLARRTTHTLTLTVEGAELLPRARQMTQEWEAIIEDIGAGAKEPSGVLRIVGPTGHGPSILAPLAARFTAKYPNVSIDLHLTDGPVDLAAMGADLMVRVGNVVGQELKVRRIGTINRWLTATPAFAKAPYIGKNQLPTTSMPIVALMPFYNHEFVLADKTGKKTTIKGRLNISTETLAAVHAAVLAGGGAALLPQWLIEKDIKAGALVRLCAKLTPEPLPVHLAFPAGRYRSSRTILFAEELERVYQETR